MCVSRCNVPSRYYTFYLLKHADYFVTFDEQSSWLSACERNKRYAALSLFTTKNDNYDFVPNYYVINKVICSKQSLFEC